MPAMAVQQQKMELLMEARVGSSGRWLIACDEHPDWRPEPFFEEAAAKQDAYQHNVHFHDGAAVQEVEIPSPLDLAASAWHSARRGRRFAMWISIVYIAFLFLLGLVTYGSAGYVMAVWACLIGLYTWRWGLLVGRERQAVAEYGQMKRMLEGNSETGDK